MGKYLIISAFGIPRDQSGSNRIYGLAKGLSNAGNEVYLLTCNWDKIRKNNHDFDSNDFSFARKIVMIDPKFNLNFIKKLRKGLDQKVRLSRDKKAKFNERKKSLSSKVLQYFTLVFPRVESSFFSVNEFFDTARMLIDKYKITNVITSFGPMFMLEVGIKIKNYFGSKIFWISDYRDELVGSSNIEYNGFGKVIKINKDTLISSDLVTTISYGLRDRLAKQLKLYGISNNEKIVVIENGIDDDLYHKLNQETTLNSRSNETIDIVYTGTIYHPSQNPEVIFQALSEMPLDARRKFRIIYAGKHSNVFKYAADKYNLSANLIDYGMVPKQKALKLQADADILLILKYNYLYEGILTGKLYDYLLFNKPILVLGNKDLEFHRRTQKIGGIKVIDYDISQVRRILNDILNCIDSLDKVFGRRNKKELDKYMYSNLANRLTYYIEVNNHLQSKGGALN